MSNLAAYWRHPITRLVFIGLSCLSLSVAIYNAALIVTSPVGILFVAKAPAKIETAMKRQIAKIATEEHLETILNDLLQREPREWLVIEAVKATAEEQGVALSAKLRTEIQKRYKEDRSTLNQIANCGNCLWNPANCELSWILFCRAPVEFTPVGDLAGLIRGGVAYYRGDEVDQLDLGLSAVGLMATIVSLPSGGTSVSVKMGTSILKTVKGMNKLPNYVTRTFTKTFRDGVDWSQVSLRKLWNLDELQPLLRPDAIAPSAAIARNTGRLHDNLGMVQTIYLLERTTNSRDLVAVSYSSEVLTDHTLGYFKILGKNRFVRTALRFSDEFLRLIFGLIGLLFSLLWFLGSLFFSRLMKRLDSSIKQQYK